MKPKKRGPMVDGFKCALSLTIIFFAALHSLALESGIPKGTPCCGPRNKSTLRDKATKIVEAIYPEEAKKEGIKDHVVVEVMIDKKGKVLSARALYGHLLLREAALEAARQWEFTPTKLNGKAVKVVGTITFHFPSKNADSKDNEAKSENNGLQKQASNNGMDRSAKRI
jgi:TonB family protein